MCSYMLVHCPVAERILLAGELPSSFEHPPTKTKPPTLVLQVLTAFTFNEHLNHPYGINTLAPRKT